MNQDIPDFKTKKRYFTSWSASIPAFAETLARLRKGALKEGETCSQIYESAGKYVFRGKMDGFDFAYKTQQGKAFWRYLFRNSLPLRECFHYAVLRNLGIPVPQVLAVGDTRKCFILKESFLVTEFLDRTEDGRVFMPGEKFRSGHEELRHAFAEKHLRELAKLHDGGYFHKAFHPRNLLFRGDSPEEMEIFWIDVARLRKMHNAKRCVVMDLHTFFRDMLLPEKELDELLQVYLFSVKKKLFSSPGELKDLLLHFKRRAFSKKKCRLFEEQNLS